VSEPSSTTSAASTYGAAMGDVLSLTRTRARTRPGQEPEPLWREALGRQLRAERSARGERITDVAQRAGVSPQYVSEVERGRKDPSSEILSALAGAVDLSVRELTRRAGVHLSAGSGGPVLLAA
jgi:DNA-binding XRE family transcriptional regulator